VPALFTGRNPLMSGPIVRKYGFPNFEQIFGKKEPQHGVDEPEAETPAEPVKGEPPAHGKSAPEGEGKAK
jgi:hypothetical protein